MNNFHYAQVLAKMLYGTDILEEDFEEIGLLGWNLIGNKSVQLYKIQSEINCSDNSIELPCNVDEIEAVTAKFEDWKNITNYTNFGDLDSAYIEENNETFKNFKSPFYIEGKLLPYHQVGDKLYFDKDYGTVNILYKGIILDDDGLPEITDKEATAIATYVSYIQKFKEGLVTNNPQIMQASEVLRQKWLQQCDQARVKYLNQNKMDEILDAKSNWNRKIFRKSYKPF